MKPSGDAAACCLLVLMLLRLLMVQRSYLKGLETSWRVPRVAFPCFHFLSLHRLLLLLLFGSLMLALRCTVSVPAAGASPAAAVAASAAAASAAAASAAAASAAAPASGAAGFA